MKAESQNGVTRPSLKFGIVGYGRLAREYYGPALSRMKDVRVVAVADTLEDSRLVAAKRIPHAHIHDSHREMMAQETLDAVLIASPPSSHLRAWLDARKHGLAAFVEKPFALTSQMEELPRLSDSEAGLMVNFNRRFWPPYQRVIEAARNGTIGGLRDIQFTFHTDVARWSTVTKHRLLLGEGGVLHDLGSQAIDLVCQITNCEPHRILASFNSRRWEADWVQLELEFPGGVSARCDLAYDETNREELTITGSEACIVLREPNMMPHVTRHAHLSPAARIADYACLGYRALFPNQRMMRHTVTQALSAFVESIRTGNRFQPGYAEARANLHLLELASAVAGVPAASGGNNG